MSGRKSTPASSAPATPTETPARVRGAGPFDEAKRAQTQLQALETKRQAILDGLSEEAAVMLEALEELRAKQSISMTPSAPTEPAAE